jgi:hypothetical protein
MLKILKESIVSATNTNSWEMTIKDLFLKENSPHHRIVCPQPTVASPIYIKGQLVSIKYHPKYQRHHKEIGIIVAINDYDTFEGMGSLHFYEILVGNEKITLLERYLDGYISDEDESTS